MWSTTAQISGERICSEGWSVWSISRLSVLSPPGPSPTVFLLHRSLLQLSFSVVHFPSARLHLICSTLLLFSVLFRFLEFCHLRSAILMIRLEPCNFDNFECYRPKKISRVNVCSISFKCLFHESIICTSKIISDKRVLKKCCWGKSLACRKSYVWILAVTDLTSQSRRW